MTRPVRQAIVFVVGCPRSGTSLVGALLAAHPAVYDAEEASLVYLFSQWQTALRRPPQAPLTEIFLERLGALVADTMRSTGWQRDVTHILDHTPWHVLCLDAVFALFPEARVVHIVRNPWDTVESLARSFQAGYAWAGNDTAARIRLWQRCLGAAEAYRDDPRVHEVRYEDLYHAPQATAQWLLSILGLDWHSRVIRRLHQTPCRSVLETSPHR